MRDIYTGEKVSKSLYDESPRLMIGDMTKDVGYKSRCTDTYEIGYTKINRKNQKSKLLSGSIAKLESELPDRYSNIPTVLILTSRSGLSVAIRSVVTQGTAAGTYVMEVEAVEEE